MWEIIHGSTQGRGHIASNTPCQDKTYFLFNNDVYSIALADGAGSAVLSHHGAEMVTRFICQNLCNNFDSYFNNSNGAAVKKVLITEALKELKNKSIELNCNISDLASTLLAVAIKDEKFILLHIGDGVIGYLKGNKLKVASYPDNGEYTNSTVFVTSKNALTEIKLAKGMLGDIEGFALMSDGAAESLYNKKSKTLSPVLHRIIQFCTYLPISEVQEQLEVGLQDTLTAATVDDCSLAVIAHTDESFHGYRRMGISEKSKLLNLKCMRYHTLKKQVHRYDELLEYLLHEQTLNSASRFLRLQPKYAKKHLERLLSLNLIKVQGNRYKTIIKL